MALRGASVTLSLAVLLSSLVLAVPAEASTRWRCGDQVTITGSPPGWGIARAQRLWNRTRAGQPLIRRTGAGAAVRLRLVNKPGASWVGRTTWLSGCRHLVELNRGVVARPAYRGHRDSLRRWTTLHELGHVLGLHHTGGTSVMATGGTQWLSGGRVTDADRAALRRLY